MGTSENALQAMDRLPISKAVFKNILPSIGIFLMMLIYNYADLFFIGMTHNDYMVSAITLASPIFMFFMAFGSLFGTGGLTLVSQDTARGETGRIRKISSFCFWCNVAQTSSGSLIQCALASLMGNSHEFHDMSLFLWQWGVICAVLPQGRPH